MGRLPDPLHSVFKLLGRAAVGGTSYDRFLGLALTSRSDLIRGQAVFGPF
jgi:hypothetical protein